MNKDTIRIAEALGYSCNGCSYYEDEKHGPQFAPNVDCGLHGCEEFRFDPSTSHDDCHALIEWLNVRGYNVDVFHCRNGRAIVAISNPKTEYGDKLEGEDYRIGVVTLTLKLLDESDE